MQKPLQDYLDELKHLLLNTYGPDLTSLVIFGSVARGDYKETSDIDLLVVLKSAEGTHGQRITRFVRVIKPLIESPDYTRLRQVALPRTVQPVVLTVAELKDHPPLLLDLTTDRLVLLDREDVFETEIAAVARRLRELGSRKVVLPDGRWYWVLKPDMKMGEVIEI